MKAIVFGNDETIIMFNLLGIEGVEFNPQVDNFEDKFEKILND